MRAGGTRRLRWEVVVLALNVVALVALALGLKLPFPGVVSYALALLVLYGLPGYLALRLLLPRARFDPVTAAALIVPLGIGTLAAQMLPASMIYPLPFAPTLLIHVGWQAGALVLLARREPPRWSRLRYRVRWPVLLVYAFVAIAAVGGIVFTAAYFEVRLPILLGGTDAGMNIYHINNIPYHPEWRGISMVWYRMQALIAWVGGLEAYQVIETHSIGPLLIVAFLNLFALAYETVRRAEVALLSVLVALAAILFETTGTGYLPGWSYLNTRVLVNIAENKSQSVYLVAPAAILLTLYLWDRAPHRRGRLVAWGAVLLALLALVGTHPLGIGLYILTAGSYILISWLVNPHSIRLRAFLSTVGGLSLFAAFVALTQVINRRLVDSVLDWRAAPLNYAGAMHLRVGAEGAYILHPAYIGAPLTLLGIGAALVMAVRLRRDRAARYVFAATVTPLIFVYTPYLASVLGNLLMPHTLERLLWMVPTGLSLALGWGRLLERAENRSLLWLVAVAAVVALIISGYAALAPLYDYSRLPAEPEHSSPELETLLGALRSLDASGSPVLAPSEVNIFLFIRLENAEVYHYREGFVELEALYQNPWWGRDAIALLQDFAPAFFVAENGSAQQTFARFQPARFTPCYQNARYTLYEVALPDAWPLTFTDRANTLTAHLAGTLPLPIVRRYEVPLPSGVSWADSIALYKKALDQNPGDWRARHGLAFALAKSGNLARAEDRYREVLAAFPEDGNVRVGLAEVLWQQHQEEEAIDMLAAHMDPATLHTLLKPPYLNALSTEHLDAALAKWIAYPAYVSGPHSARALADLILAERGDYGAARRVLEHIPPAYRTPEDWRKLDVYSHIPAPRSRPSPALLSMPSR